MASINDAYQWAINACDAPNIGYSQTYRRGQTVNGITYYDCSSFISQALTIAGFFASNPWFTTRSMGGFLESVGFTKLNPATTAWQAGDILVTVSGGHTEMVYQGGEVGAGGVTMGAHSPNVPLDEQVSINSYTTPPSYYEHLYRAQGATPVEWIKGNRYLSEEEKKNNAYAFYSSMFVKGFTINSISGMLGNIDAESTINPAVWQNLEAGNLSGGYGLVQWTPATNYIEWANRLGYNTTDGEPQCIWLNTETDKGQWITTALYPMTWEEYRTSTETPEVLASVFLKNFERAGVEVEEKRRELARQWYEYLLPLSPYPPTPSRKNKKLPIYFYLFP